MNVTFVPLGYTSCGGKSQMWVLITARISFQSLPPFVTGTLTPPASITVTLGLPPAPAMSPVGPRGHTPSSAAINSAPTQEKASPPPPRGHMSFSPTLAFWSCLLPFVIPWFGPQEGGVKLRDSFSNTETKSRNRAISLSLASTEFSTFLSLLETPWPEAAIIYFSSSQCWL